MSTEKERPRSEDSGIRNNHIFIYMYIYTCTYIYIYIYIHIHIYIHVSSSVLLSGVQTSRRNLFGCGDRWDSKISTGGVILNGTVLDVADILTINEGGEGDRAGAYSNGRKETCRRGRPGTKRIIL